MSTTKILVNTSSHKYPIYIDEGILSVAGSLYRPINSGQKAIIITDSNVEKYTYLKILKNSLAEAGWNVVSDFTVKAGEGSKSFTVLERLVNSILASGIDRSTTIFALGGGVVGDLAGFLSSILLRGIDFVQLPTSLLAQVDSSVGGKTAINCNVGKNLVGSFYQPRAVIIDINVLKSLPIREMKSGYAEIVKYGLIWDAEFWYWLQDNGGKLLKLDKEALLFAIEKSCQIKADIVSKDEKEITGIRALLNFGHTFGHAIEHLAAFDDDKIKHGEAVAIGMIIALRLSERCKLCPPCLSDMLKKHLQALDISVKPSFRIDANSMFNSMRFDKKNKCDRISFILLEVVGKAVTRNYIDDDMVSSLLTEIVNEWD